MGGGGKGGCSWRRWAGGRAGDDRGGGKARIGDFPRDGQWSRQDTTNKRGEVGGNIVVIAKCPISTPLPPQRLGTAARAEGRTQTPVECNASPFVHSPPELPPPWEVQLGARQGGDAPEREAEAHWRVFWHKLCEGWKRSKRCIRQCHCPRSPSRPLSPPLLSPSPLPRHPFLPPPVAPPSRCCPLSVNPNHGLPSCYVIHW